MITPGRPRDQRRADRVAGPGVRPGRCDLRPKFPRLVTRLGAPATGPTDLPLPEPFDADVPFKKFVSQLLALRLRRIVEADLAFRGGDLTAIGRLADEAPAAGQLLELSPVLDPEWVEDVYDELGWISLDSAPSDEGGRERLANRLRAERLTVLDRLVGAVRAPEADRGPVQGPAGGDPGRAGGQRRGPAAALADALTVDSAVGSGTRPGGSSTGCSRCWTSPPTCCRRTGADPRAVGRGCRLLEQVHAERRRRRDARWCRDLTPEEAFAGRAGLRARDRQGAAVPRGSSVRDGPRSPGSWTREKSGGCLRRLRGR